MEIVDGINFGITIGLGFLSLGVSILSIVLSIYFAKESTKAFDKIKELSNEIKSLTNNTYENQQKYSDKMLDTLISQSKFGLPVNDVNSKISDETLKILVKEVKNELEGTINLQLDETKDAQVLNKKVRADISKSIENAEIDYISIKQKLELPNNIKYALESFKAFPAHYILLRAILLSNSKSVSELEKYVDEYSIPIGWESGPIDSFITKGLLEGNQEEFHIPEKLVQPLYFWVDKNNENFKKLLNIYAHKSQLIITEEEKAISQNFKF